MSSDIPQSEPPETVKHLIEDGWTGSTFEPADERACCESLVGSREPVRQLAAMSVRRSYVNRAPTAHAPHRSGSTARLRRVSRSHTPEPRPHMPGDQSNRSPSVASSRSGSSARCASTTRAAARATKALLPNQMDAARPVRREQLPPSTIAGARLSRRHLREPSQPHLHRRHIWDRLDAQRIVDVVGSRGRPPIRNP